MSVKTDATLEGMSGYLRISKKPLPKIVLLLVGFVLWGAVFNFSGYFLNGAPIIKFHGPIDSVSPDLYQKIAENKPRDFKLSDRLNIYIVPTKNEYSQDRARHYLANAPFDFFTGFIFLLFYLLHFFLSKNQFNFVKLTVNLAIFVSIIMFLYPFFYNSFLYKFTYSEILGKYPYLRFEPDLNNINTVYLSILTIIIFCVYRTAIYDQSLDDAQVLELKF